MPQDNDKIKREKYKKVPILKTSKFLKTTSTINRMKRICTFMLSALALPLSLSAQTTTPPTGYKMVWSDEFNGTSLDTKVWNIEENGNGGGNQELQYYRKENVAVADHLTFAYPGSDPIFKEISFTAKPGQIVGITGPVACGKSTLGKSFLCEYPYEGHLTYGGRELSSYTENERSRIIGYLGHDPELLGDSVENNVLLGNDDNVWTWLRAVCLDEEVREMEEKEKTVVGNSGVRLSGGQAARLALARTLCHGKPVLVLDDPFSALDRNTEKQVFEHVKELSKDRIVFLISHRLYLFPEFDQVIWMDQKMGTCSSHERLMAENPQYAELYRAQVSEKDENILSSEKKDDPDGEQKYGDTE